MPGNKFNARKHVVDGHTFDSGKEAQCYIAFKSMEKRGEITGLTLKPVFKIVIDGKPLLIRSNGYPNGRQAKYTADFAFTRAGKRVVVDVKSPATRTEAYALRKALVEAIYHVVIEEM